MIPYALKSLRGVTLSGRRWWKAVGPVIQLRDRPSQIYLKGWGKWPLQWMWNKGSEAIKGSCKCSHNSTCNILITRGRQSPNWIILSKYKCLGSISVYPTPSDNLSSAYFMEEILCHGDSKSCLMWVSCWVSLFLVWPLVLGFFIPCTTISKNWHFFFLFQDIFSF